MKALLRWIQHPLVSAAGLWERVICPLDRHNFNRFGGPLELGMAVEHRIGGWVFGRGVVVDLPILPTRLGPEQHVVVDWGDSVDLFPVFDWDLNWNARIFEAGL